MFADGGSAWKFGANDMRIGSQGATSRGHCGLRLIGGIAAVTLLVGAGAPVAADEPDDEADASSIEAPTGDQSTSVDGSTTFASWAPDVDMGSFYAVNKAINSNSSWSRSDEFGQKYTGRGIGVALIDSGVVPVPGLDAPGKVIHGPDLSFESQSAELAHLDTYGHGTHLAGIIAGRDADVPAGNENDSTRFVGVAPDAHLVSLKVAASDGATDVSQVIAAIDWVVAHRNDPGLDVRVLNLSFGTEALQPYEIDPLAHAVENAWHHGIVVVVAAGNDGATATVLNNPAIDPYVIAVGAADHVGTESTDDDVLASFSSVGNDSRSADLLAPGRSITSLRAPGSWIDERHPEARVAFAGRQRFFRGSGTSQAAAVVSGAVALLLDEDPTLTPDEVKYLLTSNARPLSGPTLGQGAGLLDLKDIDQIDPSSAPIQQHPRSRGTGSLELARGGSHVAHPETGVELVGEFDIFGRPWVGSTWAAASSSATSWQGTAFNGTAWTGIGWTSSPWTGKTWRTTDWVTTDWAGKTWRVEAWLGKTWRNVGWDGKTWRSTAWLGKTWRDATWAGKTWRDSSWAGRVWR